MRSLIAARAIAGMGGGGYALCVIFLPFLIACLVSWQVNSKVNSNFYQRFTSHSGQYCRKRLDTLVSSFQINILMSSHASPKESARSLSRNCQHVSVALVKSSKLWYPWISQTLRTGRQLGRSCRGLGQWYFWMVCKIVLLSLTGCLHGTRRAAFQMQVSTLTSFYVDGSHISHTPRPPSWYSALS